VRLLVVQHETVAGLGRLRPHLEAAAELDERRPDLADPLPETLDDHDGLVVLGGAVAAWEDERAPWLPATRALMVRAVDERVPLLGICLGAQLLAHATGGRVERGAAGIEAGVSTITPTADAAGDPLMAALPAQGYQGPQGHSDAVTALPPGAVLLATGEQYRHQAFRVGATAWGVQYHPEVTEADFTAWMDGDGPALAAVGKRAADAVGEVLAARTELDALAAAHARAFTAIVAGATAGGVAGATAGETAVEVGGARAAVPAAG
jgi:GMP synthase-like glutamine amidotransferase